MSDSKQISKKGNARSFGHKGMTVNADPFNISPTSFSNAQLAQSHNQEYAVLCH